jgi:hypothetical protein
MKRSAPMKRTPFKRPTWTPKPCKAIEYQPKPRAAAVAVADTRAKMVVQVPKAEPARHEGYRRLVAALPCISCGVPAHSQAAHPNTGKGAGMKTDDRECFPLCADMPLMRGCHSLFDQGAVYPKALRRKVEPKWGRWTREQIRKAGAWPADLEPWPEDMETTA